MLTYHGYRTREEKYWDACYKGNVDMVRNMITNENKSFKTYDVMIHCFKNACKGGHFEIFDILNDYKYIMTLSDQSLHDCFHDACQGGNLDICEQLVRMFDCNYGYETSLEKEEIKKNIDLFFSDGLRGACKGGKLEICVWCMNFLHKIETSDNIHNLLYLASQSGVIEVVNLIILYDSIFNTIWDWDWDTALEHACIGGCVEIAKLFVAYGANDFDGGLLKACENEKPDMIKYMIECGASRTDKFCIYYVCNIGDLKLASYFLKKFPVKMTELEEGVRGACSGGDLKLVKFLIKKGEQKERRERRKHGKDGEKFNVNWDQCLLEACYGDNVTIVNFLITLRPINFNLGLCVIEARKNRCVNIVDYLLKIGKADLHVACFCGYLNLVEKWLDDMSSNVNDINNCMEAAVNNNHTEIVELLLTNGAGSDINVLNRCMNTACYAGNINIVRLMLLYGATNIDECFQTHYDYDKNADVFNIFITAGVTNPDLLDLLEDVDDLKLYCLYCKHKGIKLERERYHELIHKEPACVLFSGSKLTKNNHGDKLKCSVKRLPHDLFNMMILY